MEYYDEDPGCCCPRCGGMCSIDCNCGGDLCVCETYGEQECPMCHGEGTVSEPRYNLYMERRRAAWAELEKWQKKKAKKPPA